MQLRRGCTCSLPVRGEVTAAYRSLLYLEQIKERGVNALKSWRGPEGIEHYLSADHKGRLIKLFLVTPGLGLGRRAALGRIRDSACF